MGQGVVVEPVVELVDEVDEVPQPQHWRGWSVVG